MKPSPDDQRVLSIDPSTKGFGFVILEGPEQLIDWGTKAVKGNKNRESLKKLIELIEQYRPEVMVVEDYQHKSSRRSIRVRRLLTAITALASQEKLRVRRVSRLAVKNAFVAASATTKHDIAGEIAKRFPELAPQMPRVRKPWMSEDHRMSTFDALSFALTLFDSNA